MQAGDEKQVLHVMRDTGRQLVHHAHFLGLGEVGFGLIQRLLLESQLVAQRGDLVARAVLGLPDAVYAQVGADPVENPALRILDGRQRRKTSGTVRHGA
jgi:hypothetical protein